MGEQLQLQARRKAVTNKQIAKKKSVTMVTTNIHMNNDVRETVLIIEAGKILAKMEPNRQKLETHNWTLEDAKHKAEELRQIASLQRGKTEEAV